MKKILNSTENAVLEMCEGIEAAYPEKLTLNKRYKYIRKKKLDQNKVTLITGGGSGHEPAHAGYVGNGLLDAAVCGDVFASPSTMQVYNTIVDTESDKGTLLIIKNYSGDCMNFDAAAEMAEEDDDIKVEKVFVNDDIAVDDSLHSVGRRGVAGTVFVHKIAGAAAEKGMELSEVKRVAQKAIDNVRTMGIALTSCIVPAKGTPTLKLSNDEIEYGVGIHGEPGIKREKITTADELSERMVTKIIKEKPFEAQDEVAVMINGFGATPLMELFVVNKKTSEILKNHKINICKTFVGNYMTSLEMAGASITLLKLDEELKELLNFPCSSPALQV